jgi:hypothetical protein
MRPSRAQLVAGSAVIFATLSAAAFVLSRTQERTVESANGSPAETSSLVEAYEDVDPTQPAQVAVASPTEPSTLSSAAKPQRPVLLPRIPNDPLTLAFAAEGTDPSWSDLTEGQILGELSRLAGLSLITIDVECRTTLCRVQSVYPTADPRARQRVLGVAATLGLEPRPVVAVSNKSGNVVFLAYFARSTTSTEPRP